MSFEDDNDEVEPSELGTREYWDGVYSNEVKQFREFGEEGEIWFGEDVLETMADWTADLLRERKPGTEGDGTANDLLDVGTGNATFLLVLADRGYAALTGTDYSKASIELAKAVVSGRGMSQVVLEEDDLLNTKLTKQFDVITDKGTYDAIGLSENGQADKAQYRVAVWDLLKSDGILVITSCNNTADELKEQFSSYTDGRRFVYIDHVRTYPTFRFGGIEGTKVCTVAFEKDPVRQQ